MVSTSQVLVNESMHADGLPQCLAHSKQAVCVTDILIVAIIIISLGLSGDHGTKDSFVSKDLRSHLRSGITVQKSPAGVHPVWLASTFSTQWSSS